MRGRSYTYLVQQMAINYYPDQDQSKTIIEGEEVKSQVRWCNYLSQQRYDKNTLWGSMCKPTGSHQKQDRLVANTTYKLLLPEQKQKEGLDAHYLLPATIILDLHNLLSWVTSSASPKNSNHLWSPYSDFSLAILYIFYISKD